MLQPGRQYSAGTGYRYGFNGKENDNEVKGEGNQQDYGMRVYDPRIGKFFSIDPIISNYPELTPYQFASNRPISAIDLDGLQAKDLERELEPIRAQRKREQAYGIVYKESKNEKILKYAVGIGLGAPLLATVGAGTLLLGTASTQIAISNIVLWITNPLNQGLVLLFAEGALELINPDPGYSVDLSPGPGGELVKSFKMLFKSKNTGKVVSATFEDGAKFKNIIEVDWFEKLLGEGNNIQVLKEINTGAGEQSADWLVNGIKTEIKGISNMITPKLGDNIKATVQDAIKQAGDGGNIIIDVTGQNGATKELLQETITRLQGNAKQTTNYRIVGVGFELNGIITPKKQ